MRNRTRVGQSVDRRHQIALQQAITYFGSERLLGAAIGVSQQQINYWRQMDSPIRYDLAWRIVLATKGCIAIHELRPDCSDIHTQIQQQLMQDFVVNAESGDLEIKISCVQLLNPLRQDYGDLNSLVADIQQRGLLEPIGVNDRLVLLYGERRLKAFQMLKRATIPARILPIESAIEAKTRQYAFTKELTISERVSFAKIMIAEFGERRGRPTHTFKNSVERHTFLGRTQQYIAEQLGFGSSPTYRRACKIIEQGTPELIQAVDQGQLSIYAAYRQLSGQRQSIQSTSASFQTTSPFPDWMQRWQQQAAQEGLVSTLLDDGILMIQAPGDDAMARIRTVKPELFQHEALFDAEQKTQLPLRLAFIGLFTCCDRDGRFSWQPRRLKVSILPYDSVDFSTVLEALAEYQLIIKYQVHGQYYGCIPSWHRHQRINTREAISELPPPSEPIQPSSNTPSKPNSLTPLPTSINSSKAPAPQQPIIQTIFDHWRQAMDCLNTPLDVERQKQIERGLNLGYSVEQLCQAISGCKQTPYNQGNNQRGEAFNGLSVIFRNADNIDRFIRNYHHPPSEANSNQQKVARQATQMKHWMRYKMSKEEASHDH